MMSSGAYQAILVVGIIATVIAVCVDIQPASSVVGANRTSVLIVDLHLEECIKQLQLGNAEDALNHCQSADQELDAFLANMTDPL